MEDYVCCRELAQQLDEYFLKGDSDRFYEVSTTIFSLISLISKHFMLVNLDLVKLWGSLMGNPEDSSADPNQDLFLLVDFKLKVHFTVMKLLTSNEDNSIEKFSRFLQEKGSIFSKFKELAPYFAIPYITDNPKHFLLLDIQKVLKNRTKKIMGMMTLCFHFFWLIFFVHPKGRMGTKFENFVESSMGEKIHPYTRG